MRYLSTEYVTGEIIDTVALMQLNGETVPVIDSQNILEIAEAFIFEWNEIGDPEMNFEEMLLQHLRTEFKYNYNEKLL